MRRRSGFTIVELLVSMALIMFIMAILSEAFVAALKSFRDLKGTADMAERLRAVSTILRRELSADHFGARARLSQPDFYVNGPPQEGFFRIYQGTASLAEGYDPTELAVNPVASRYMTSHRATDHMLHFAVKLRGNERGDYFSAGNIPVVPRIPPVPTPTQANPLLSSALLQGQLHYEEPWPPSDTLPGTYCSQWAEVVYFLRQLPDTAKGTPLFALYRRQLLIVPDNGLLGTPNIAPGAFTAAPVAGVIANYPEMSCRQVGGAVYFNDPRDVTMPSRRFGMNIPGAAGAAALAGTLVGVAGNANTYPMMGDTNAAYQGADLLLTDVLSFEVRVLPAITQAAGPHFVDLFDAELNTNVYLNNNTQYSTAGQPRIFDTWSSMVEKPAPPPANQAVVYDYSNYATGGGPQSIPFKTGLRLNAVEVIIRVWDEKTEQTRQITIVQNL
jgi:hypothetical protein